MLQLKMGIHNHYTIYKESPTQPKHKVAEFDNLITDKGFNWMVINDPRVNYMCFGSGSTEPQISDTSLTKQIFTGNIDHYSASDYAEDSLNFYFTFKVPADTSHVGTITEVGIYGGSGGYGYGLITHALIKDAEGNPIAITKSDTEVLYVDVHVKVVVTNSGGFKWNYNYPLYFNAKARNIGIPAVCCLPSFALLRSEPSIMSDGGVLAAKKQATHTYNASSHTDIISANRFGTDVVTSQHYINAISFYPNIGGSSYAYNGSHIPLGWWKYPNTDIFPNRTLTGMSVGAGDGTTKEFTPPLNLWVKNTEKIYIDGVLKTRDVDYTCDNRNNLSILTELCPTAFTTILNDYQIATSKQSNYGIHPFNGGLLNTSYFGSESTDTGIACYIWDADHPLTWKLEEDPQIGMEADGFYLNNLATSAGSNVYWQNVTVSIYYSTDNETWNLAGTYTETSRSSYLSHKFEFEQTINAPYWKLIVDTSAGSSSHNGERLYARGISYLYRNGFKIVFIEAPAENAVITMDADIDRPMKNDNFIIDVNPSFTLG